MVLSRVRETLLLKAVENHLSYDETQELLRKYGELELYARYRRDSIIIWGLYHNKEITEINALCRHYHCCLLKDKNKMATGSSRVVRTASAILEQK